MLPLLTYLALTVPGANGQPVKINTPSEIPSGGLTKGQSIIQTSITILLTVTVILSLFFIIFGGIKWITSGGDKTKLDSARKTIIYAVVGLILAFLSFFILNTVGAIFGVKLLNPSF